jgi:hypothetical protein
MGKSKNAKGNSIYLHCFGIPKVGAFDGIVRHLPFALVAVICPAVCVCKHLARFVVPIVLALSLVATRGRVWLRMWFLPFAVAF